jgi:hypothetical protein
MTGRPLHGVVAEFDDAERVAAAVEALTGEGYTKLDVYAPFPMRDVAKRLGIRTASLAWIAAIAGLVGACIQYGAQYWLNVVDYPIDVGGRPLHSWPAFIPSTIIVSILWAGAATLLGMLAILRLPRLHHPIFAAPGFRRASEDRFFVCILAEDPLFAPSRAAGDLARFGPKSLNEVEA